MWARFQPTECFNGFTMRKSSIGSVALWDRLEFFHKIREPVAAVCLQIRVWRGSGS